MHRDQEAALFYQIQADKEKEMEDLELAMKNSLKTNTTNVPVVDRMNKPVDTGLTAVAPMPCKYFRKYNQLLCFH